MTAGPPIDVLIVGAGIVGAACADELSACGFRVAIVERAVVGGGATAAGMGHLVVMDDNPAELALSTYSNTLWRALVAESPERHEYSRCGTIWIAADDVELAAARDKQRTLAEHGIVSELLDAHTLYEQETCLRPGLAGGLLVAQDGIVYPPKSAQFLLDRACARGARLIVGDVKHLSEQGVKLTDGRQIAAGIVLVANGMAAVDLVPELPLRAKKGQLVITDRYPGFARHQLVELGYIKSAHAADGNSVAFNLQPRPTGQLLIGSSRQFDSADTAIDNDMLARMLARAAEYVPGLADLHALRCWTGVRAASPDGLPLLGPHPTRPRVWLAVGHEGLGITTSLASAKLLAAQLTGGATEIPFAAYLPERLRAQEPPHV